MEGEKRRDQLRVLAQKLAKLAVGWVMDGNTARLGIRASARPAST